MEINSVAPEISRMTQKPEKQIEGSLKEMSRHLFSGAISGLFAGGIMQPIQVIKTSMQVSPIEKIDRSKTTSTYFQTIVGQVPRHHDQLGFREATHLVYSKEGLKGFYRGITPSLAKNGLNAGSYFASLNVLVK